MTPPNPSVETAMDTGTVLKVAPGARANDHW